ncbi:MAG TPA: mycothiol system anti-sigma-R factor [Nocardioidaceae bacterium]|nr:mycothiol system anti-sigma-R factor [Nocardioidaceae bacterium]
MSCGNHHDVDCEEILQRVVTFIDHELADADCATIQQHLDECGPCLREFDLETKVKALVKKSCSEHAPETLRERVILSIRQVQITITEE